jgi:hypothetical protein
MTGDAEIGSILRGDPASVSTLETPLTAPARLCVLTLDEFVAVDEAGAAALLGDPDNALIPENGDVMIYGDGGAGKTTLAVDFTCHLAAGDDWLGIPVARPVRVLLIENEGPRPMFRAKLRRKREAWDGSPLDDRILVIDEPWSQITLASEHYRRELAAMIDEFAIDVIVLGPVTRAGMNEAGTLQEVRDFMLWIADVRRRAGRPVVFVLVHHENKGGKVSGAWEGAGDTLLHVSGQGAGHTRMYVQKARWSSKHHATTMRLVWTPGEGFAASDAAERDDDTIAAELLASAIAHPGASWTAISKGIPGKAERLREIRDRLITGRHLVNTGTDARPKLWNAADPAIDAIRPDRDDFGTASPSAPEERATSQSRPPSHPKRDGDGDGLLLPRSEGPDGDGLAWH